MRRFISYGPAFVVILAAAVILAVTPSVVRRASIARQEVQIQTARRVLAEGTVLEQINEAVRHLALAVEPSIVDLSVTLGGDGLAHARSTGSGWVYDTLGHIVTNAHVVRNAQHIDVQFPDGRVYAAHIVGLPDVYTDIAVLRVEASEGLFPLPRASGQPVLQGDRVFAFGSPFGFKFSMTEGIVSGTGRDAATPISTRGFTNFIQHDAAVNPGNSGGPLVDVRGRVIGMNVAIATANNRRPPGDPRTPESEGQSAGISFAIPMHTIESVVGQLIDSGEVRRGFMGIQLSNEDVRPGDLPGFVGTGVFVGGVTPDGPAAAAGLQRGDVITELNGAPIRSGEVLRSVISSARPGERIDVTVWRRGETLEATVTLGEFPPEVLAAEGGASALVRFGMYVEQTRLGPIVAGVLPESSAEEAGFRAGQIVLRVGDTPVETTDQMYLAMASQGLLHGRSVPVTVASPGDEATDATTQTLQVQVVN